MEELSKKFIKSPDTEEPEESKGDIEIQESPETATNQTSPETQSSKISSETDKEPSKQETETSKSTPSLEAQADEEKEPGASGNKDENPDEGYEIINTSEVSVAEKIAEIGRIILGPHQTSMGYRPESHTVGIFSRSSESDYEWLFNQLKSQPFHITVSTVLPHYISNNGGRQFREAVSRCTFGILYHTKKRGRINIVDINGSVYDEELRYLCDHLGKKKVIVVVDDLEDTSSKEKARILEAQPSIRMLAKDLFLFKEVEKQNRTMPIVK